MKPVLIEVSNLQKSYFSEGVETPILHDLTFSITEGEFVAIMGPSGSGKSTLLHILGFLDRHTTGEYRFKGKSIDDYSKDEVARVRNEMMGFVFQAFNLLPRISVLENVKLPLLYSRVAEREWNRRAEEAIRAVGLAHRFQFDAVRLSGGEKQRVAIARALVNSPSVIFADEPTGNLDSRSGVAVMDILQALNEERGHTIILITHEAYMAEHAERVIHILDGRIDKDEKVMKRIRK
ncbi:MAG: hypothetical protein A3F26_02695 [Candidatus Ryanbacteria bacterium RIFCSPHIGHO2_12_FULL_47_12b]|uniref:ABC transporter domain-containing protein n=2 Tax=Candidatus Ryaniibacteriota TaxID=1817914 RepID=A0A1G2H5B3_9BACT|nr:MAG: Macrolide-specific efflux protein MacB [Parcubacteria group bacterium GW2011_GWA2_47_10b]KKU85168.1 MAG: Macrolide-specific efflux protein MacB [Parcubacteria group bacterium GW2011_GWA1_47_9]OGZ45159.1 MAG: hypothetical protein A2844_01150 [Candidatus Ryanbacteria bacterium RIFCSPHIGHO2_01_FULL_48_80]OGZ49818.1 MAG: hypothetical protein A3C83_01760 [Candidatus Ryanbacteria bacterium RIFCSPHIGHO2_02_FULL_47_25]OGZ52147.1 MAG: hypothetical protein A3F26_02695 [Candidatus Ryanbacteria bac